MSPRAARHLASLLAIAACRSRAQRDATADAPPVTAASSAPTPRPEQATPSPAPTGAGAAEGPWQSPDLRAAAVSPARWVEGSLRSAAAIANEAGSSEMRWLSWSAAGAAVLARHPVRWVAPGSTMALVPRVGGATVVWPTAPADAGATWRAIDVTATSFAGDERDATALEVEASEWALLAMARRSREGVDEPAPGVTLGGLALRVEPRRAPPAAMLDDVTLTRGDDLLGFERALGLDPDDAAARWVALSRGACRESRVELYRAQREDVTCKGSVPIGREVGVRWIRVHAGPTAVAVSWYQSLIPMRLACTRGAEAPTVADQGLRLAVFPR